MIEQIFIFLVAFQVKHFICDYPLQTEFMLGKFKEHGWMAPLSAHCFVHAMGTMLVISFFGDIVWSNAYFLVLFGSLDYTLHFIMDRVKASPKLLGRFKSDNKYFWWALGGDQAYHHLTHYLIIYLAVS